MKRQVTKNSFPGSHLFHAAFEKLVLKLNEQNSGSAEVAIQLENNLTRGDRFLITSTFPYHLLDLARLRTDLRKWQKVIEAVPHLFQKQKVVYLNGSWQNDFAATVADTFYKNDFDKKSVHLKTLKDFNFLKNKHQKAIIFQEYRFNYSRFYVETLKYFEDNGGKILLPNDAIRNETGKKPAVSIPVKTYPQFVMRVNEHNSVVQFTGESNDIIALQVDNSTPLLSKLELQNICNSYFSFEPGKVKTTEIFDPPPVHIIHEIVSRIKGRMSCSFESSQLKDYYEICLEKFDLAKQTGISFEEFKPYFHRYGKAIDEITETAYQLLEKNRNPQKLWELAEQEYQKENEWQQISK